MSAKETKKTNMADVDFSALDRELAQMAEETPEVPENPEAPETP